MVTLNPILDEIRKTREQLLAEAGGTLTGLVAKLQEEESKSGHEILDPKKLREAREKAEKAEKAVPVLPLKFPLNDQTVTSE